MEDEPTPSQIVAANLRKAREAHGWTQAEAGERIAEYVGEPWSKARWSQVEASGRGGRPRSFSVEELLAFSDLFDLPIAWFLVPPEGIPADRSSRFLMFSDEMTAREIHHVRDVARLVRTLASKAGEPLEQIKELVGGLQALFDEKVGDTE